MYEEFYGFSASPFSLLPDADFLYPSRRHKRAMNMLEYGTVTQAGFVVITGEVGAGKTTILRRYIKSVQDDITLGIITNPSANYAKLLGWVAAAFDLPCQGQEENTIYHAFVDFLLDQYGKGKRTVLIIDEAQNLDTDRLEELRMLSNVNNEKDQLLQIILVGQPELLETLRRPDMSQLVQRVAVHCHLDPMDRAETASYIRHRLQVVGGSPDLFDDRACAAVYYFARGVPRLINLLCDQALVYAYSEEQPNVAAEVVCEVALDRAQMGLSPFREVETGTTVEAILSKIDA